MKFHPGCLVAGPLAALGLVAVLAGIGAGVWALLLERTTPQTTGTIIAFEAMDNGFVPKIEYEIDGKKYLLSDSAIERQVVIAYEAGQPERSRLHSSQENWFIAGCLFGGGVLFVLVGSLLAIKLGASRAPEREAAVESVGKAAAATVESISGTFAEKVVEPQVEEFEEEIDEEFETPVETEVERASEKTIEHRLKQTLGPDASPYCIAQRPMPEGEVMETLLPWRVGPFRRDELRIVGDIHSRPIHATYRVGDLAVYMELKLCGSVAGAQKALATAKAETAAVTGFVVKAWSEATEPAYLKVVHYPIEAFLAWTRGGYYFSADAKTEKELDEFMKSFPF